MPIERVRFLGAAAYGGDATPAPIRTRDDEEREGSRDDVRVYAIFGQPSRIPPERHRRRPRVGHRNDISARLLNQVGQPLADLPAAISNGTCEVTVPLGSVAAGDYVVEMSAAAGGEAARQFVAFRVLAR